MSQAVHDEKRLSESWWETSIIEMKPGMIRLRGYPVEELIGNISFPAMIWLMLRGELPDEKQAQLLGAALGAAVDHGPQAPSIAIGRMAITCGVGINSAMASAINVLGDVHGGAGEQAAELYQQVSAAWTPDVPLEAAIESVMTGLRAQGMTHVPGFGHRFHPVDPRAGRLLDLIAAAAQTGTVSGRYGIIAAGVEKFIESTKKKRIPMNIDGATAAVYAELGFAPALCRGLFVLSRSVGILSHICEQAERGERNKGPIPRQFLWAYDGVEARHLPEQS